MRAAREGLRDEVVVLIMGWLGCLGKRFGKLGRILHLSGMMLLVLVELRWKAVTGESSSSRALQIHRC
jgi:hypothetical protein